MRLYYKLIFLWVFISACGKHTDWRKPYDMTISIKGTSLYKIKQDGKWGIATADGQILLPLAYDLIGGFDNGILRVYQDSKLGVVNDKGQLIAPVGRYDIISRLSSRLWLVEKESKKGIIDLEGQELAPLLYNQIDLYSMYQLKANSDEPMRILLMQAPRHSALMDEKGRYLIPPQYDSIALYKQVFYVRYNDKEGVFNDRYQQIVPFEYDSINRNIVVLNGKYGYIDNKGKIGVQPKYEKLAYLNREMIGDINLDYTSTLCFQQGKKWGLIKDAKVLIPARYDKIRVRHKYDRNLFYDRHEFMCEYYYEVSNKGKMGWIDSLGRTIVPCAYEEIKYTADKNVFGVFNDNMAGLVKLGGELILPPSIKCTSIDNFHGGLARVVTIIPSQHLFNVCFVNKKGEWRGFPEYENVGDFSNKGVAFAIKNKKLGLIDTLGNEILPCIYDLYSFDDYGESYIENTAIHDYFEEGVYYYDSPYKTYHKGFAYGAEIVTLNNKDGLINESGQFILPTKYDAIERMSPTLYLMARHDKTGLINKDGKVVLSLKYEYVGVEENGEYWGELRGSRYEFTPSGKLIE